MQASAFQQLHSENVALHKALNELQRENDGLRTMLQQKQLEVHGERVSNMITALASAIHAPAKGRQAWWRRFGKGVAHHLVDLPTAATVVVPQALIDEVSQRPYCYATTSTKDESTGTQRYTVTRRSTAEIAEIEQRLKAQQDAIIAAQKEAAEKAATPPVVGLDGQTPARETAGKILTVAR